MCRTICPLAIICPIARGRGGIVGRLTEGGGNARPRRNVSQLFQADGLNADAY